MNFGFLNHDEASGHVKGRLNLIGEVLEEVEFSVQTSMSNKFYQREYANVGLFLWTVFCDPI